MGSLQCISMVALCTCLPYTGLAQSDKGAKLTDGVDRNQIAISHRSNLNRYSQIRAFEDPCTHLRWILMEDLNHPAAPRILSQAHGTATSIDAAHAPAIRSGA